MAALSKTKPPRDYPNMNAVLALSLTLDLRPRVVAGATQPVPGSSSGLRLNTPVAIGTIPAGSFLVASGVSVKAATTGAATIDIGTEAAPTKYFAATPLNATAYLEGNSTTLGVVDAETVVYATLKGSADLSNGLAKVVIAYYAKND
jgi:hypothetical protein